MILSCYCYRSVTVPLPFRYNVTVTERQPPLPTITDRYGPFPIVTKRYMRYKPNQALPNVTNITERYKRM